jgi:NTP pyrophosphatase (non-canonical NTP hydrolase)
MQKFLIALAMALFFVGCSKNDTPQDVAVGFVEMVSDGEVEEAKEFATQNAAHLFKNTTIECLAKEAYEVANKIDKAKKDESKRKKLARIISELSSSIEKIQKKAEKEVKSKHPDWNNLSRFERNIIMMEAMDAAKEEMVKPLSQAIKKMMDELEIQTPHPKEVSRVLAHYMVQTEKIAPRRVRELQTIISQNGIASDALVTKECLSNSTTPLAKLTNIDDIEVEKVEGEESKRAKVYLRLTKGEKKQKAIVFTQKSDNGWMVEDITVVGRGW